MPDGPTQEVLEALRDTLQANLKVLVPAAKTCTYKFEPEDFSSVLCPAIFIFDGGWDKEFETIRGRTGAVADPGIAQRRYNFDVDVYLKGRRVEDLRKQLRQWADGVTAVVEDNWALGVTGIAAISAQAKAGEPTAPLEQGSAVLMATRVRIVADVWMFQGSMTL
jgi:hypothetical protein